MVPTCANVQQLTTGLSGFLVLRSQLPRTPNDHPEQSRIFKPSRMPAAHYARTSTTAEPTHHVRNTFWSSSLLRAAGCLSLKPFSRAINQDGDRSSYGDAYSVESSPFALAKASLLAKHAACASSGPVCKLSHTYPSRDNQPLVSGLAAIEHAPPAFAMMKDT